MIAIIRMRSKILKGVAILSGGLAVLAGAAFWWLMLDARAPSTPGSPFDLEVWRTLASEDPDCAPRDLRMEIVGGDRAPGWAAEAGRFGTAFVVAYTSFQLTGPCSTIVIGGAVDPDGAKAAAQSDEAWFDDRAYARMTAAMLEADLVMVTHEHFDHVLGIVRHPDPAGLARRLALNGRQLFGLNRFSPPEEIMAIAPRRFDDPVRIAPGVVVAAAPGHSPGTQVIFIRLATGREYLLIGDIVWVMSNLQTLKTRPRIMQYLLFEPNEQRGEVLRQVRALSAMARANPDLIMVPSHDRPYLDRLVAEGLLTPSFVLEGTQPSRSP